MENRYFTTKQALQLCKEAGMNMNLVTLLKIARDRNFLHQPTGKFGKCWLDREGVEEFIKTAA